MKIDCGRTENYLKYTFKMCAAYLDDECNECPLSHKNNGMGNGCADYQENFPKEAIEILQKWVDENIHDDGGSREEDQEEDKTPKSMWIENALGLICTCGHCGASRLGVSDYCPNCGAKMTR